MATHNSLILENETNRQVMIINFFQLNLNQILENFQDQKFVEHAKTLLRQRRAKRNRNKQRKKERILEKEQVRREREEKEAKIDAWRTKLQREQESKRRVCISKMCCWILSNDFVMTFQAKFHLKSPFSSVATQTIIICIKTSVYCKPLLLP